MILNICKGDGFTGIALLSILLLMNLEARPARAQDLTSRLVPTDVAGSETCNECHAPEVATWKNTAHHLTFTRLPRSEQAETIADKLDIFDIQEEGRCMGCHFTLRQTPDMERPRAIEGISCEICHGAAREWKDLHNDLGEFEVTNEPPDHKGARIEAARAKGMRSTYSIYETAKRCFQCHTVPDEELVNIGGHTAGSDFELVAWTQGEVRHNFLQSRREDAGAMEENREATAERRALMYVIGKAMDLEYGLRGTAKAKANADYARAMARRTLAAFNAVKAIKATGAVLPRLDEMLDAVPKRDDGRLRITLNNEEELTAAADRVGEACQALEAEAGAHAAEFAKIQALVPGADAYHSHEE